MLDSHDNRKTRLDFLGAPWTRTRAGMIHDPSGLVRATVVKFLIKKPKKPNSANRRYALVNLAYRTKTAYAAIPNEGHTL